MAASPYRRPLRAPAAPPARRSPWTRAALATAVVAMLPFVWSEDICCDGKPQQLLTGAQILFGKQFDEPTPGLIFLGLLAMSVGLGFLATRTQRPWRRFAAELVSSAAALATAFMCCLMFTRGRPTQPYDHPAAWIGTLASFAITIQACFLSGAALRSGIEGWRARRRAPGPRVAALTRARVAPVQEVAPAEDEDDEWAALENAVKEPRSVLRRP